MITIIEGDDVQNTLPDSEVEEMDYYSKLFLPNSTTNVQNSTSPLGQVNAGQSQSQRQGQGQAKKSSINKPQMTRTEARGQVNPTIKPRLPKVPSLSDILNETLPAAQKSSCKILINKDNHTRSTKLTTIKTKGSASNSSLTKRSRQKGQSSEYRGNKSPKKEMKKVPLPQIHKCRKKPPTDCNSNGSERPTTAEIIDNSISTTSCKTLYNNCQRQQCPRWATTRGKIGKEISTSSLDTDFVPFNGRTRGGYRRNNRKNVPQLLEEMDEMDESLLHAEFEDLHQHFSPVQSLQMIVQQSKFNKLSRNTRGSSICTLQGLINLPNLFRTSLYGIVSDVKWARNRVYPVSAASAYFSNCPIPRPLPPAEEIPPDEIDCNNIDIFRGFSYNMKNRKSSETSVSTSMIPQVSSVESIDISKSMTEDQVLSAQDQQFLENQIGECFPLDYSVIHQSLEELEQIVLDIKQSLSNDVVVVDDVNEDSRNEENNVNYDCISPDINLQIKMTSKTNHDQDEFECENDDQYTYISDRGQSSEAEDEQSNYTYCESENEQSDEIHCEPDNEQSNYTNYISENEQYQEYSDSSDLKFPKPNYSTCFKKLRELKDQIMIKTSEESTDEVDENYQKFYKPEFSCNSRIFERICDKPSSAPVPLPSSANPIGTQIDMNQLSNRSTSLSHLQSSPSHLRSNSRGRSRQIRSGCLNSRFNSLSNVQISGDQITSSNEKIDQNYIIRRLQKDWENSNLRNDVKSDVKPTSRESEQKVQNLEYSGRSSIEELLQSSKKKGKKKKKLAKLSSHPVIDLLSYPKLGQNNVVGEKTSNKSKIKKKLKVKESSTNKTNNLVNQKRSITAPLTSSLLSTSISVRPLTFPAKSQLVKKTKKSDSGPITTVTVPVLKESGHKIVKKPSSNINTSAVLQNLSKFIKIKMSNTTVVKKNSSGQLNKIKRNSKSANPAVQVKGISRPSTAPPPGSSISSKTRVMKKSSILKNSTKSYITPQTPHTTPCKSCKPVKSKKSDETKSKKILPKKMIKKSSTSTAFSKSEKGKNVVKKSSGTSHKKSSKSELSSKVEKPCILSQTSLKSLRSRVSLHQQKESCTRLSTPIPRKTVKKSKSSVKSKGYDTPGHLKTLLMSNVKYPQTQDWFLKLQESNEKMMRKLKLNAKYSYSPLLFADIPQFGRLLSPYAPSTPSISSSSKKPKKKSTIFKM